MTRGRKHLVAAVVLLALTGLAGYMVLLRPGAEAAATACTSCDARHQNHLRLMANRTAETTP